ncbi:MAG: glycosyltransferase [Anaerolineae bacterium]
MGAARAHDAEAPDHSGGAARRLARYGALVSLMTIYAGLVTYNSRDDLPGCLAGLRAQTMLVTTIALDNASSDGSAGLVARQRPEVRLIARENLGYGRGHNAIIRSAAPVLAITSRSTRDAALAPDYVARLVETLAAPQRRMGDGQAAHGRPAAITAPGMAAAQRLRLQYRLRLAGRRALCRIARGVRAPGAAVVYKAELIRDLSADGDFFDPAMFLYAEDSDIDWRARRQGWRCWYVAEAGRPPSGRRGEQRDADHGSQQPLV